MQRARSLRLASGKAGGFTLVEMLVAVGAVAFIAVGIASIFASVGDTVSRGRSVSAITQYAAVLERQMRDDFEAMTRDGYLIIRHELANDGDPVPLFADQPVGQWRERRVDELMFFVNKSSRSARESLAPGVVAEGSSARIYYGMGQRLSDDIDTTSQYARPDITDRNRTPGLEERLGFEPSTNPNRFAGEWTLLRQETTLSTPGGSLSDDPGLGVAQDVWRDNRLQVGLQPAAESIFRSVNLLVVSPCPIRFPSVETFRRDQLGTATADADESPLFESGIVDIATTNLEEIRGIVQASAGLLHIDSATQPFNPTQPPYGYLAPVNLTDCNFYIGPNRVVGPVGVQQAWMLDGMPAQSHPFQLDFDQTDAVLPGQEPSYRLVRVPEEEIARIRYEPEPPDIYTPLSSTGPRSAIRLADQYALAASGFIPRVSEFIVEWSFGKTDESGRLIWHGAERGIDSDGDGTNDRFVFPYPQYTEEVRDTAPALAGGFFVPYRLAQPPTDPSAEGVGDEPLRFDRLPQLADAPETFVVGDFAEVGSGFSSFPVYPEVIHGVRATGLTPANPASVVSYFGYTLPNFDPEDPDGNAATADGAAQQLLDWPWPELVRVTVTLTDPGDESIERTFQYVFPTPGNPAR